MSCAIVNYFFCGGKRQTCGNNAFILKKSNGKYNFFLLLLLELTHSDFYRYRESAALNQKQVRALNTTKPHTITHDNINFTRQQHVH